MVQCGLWPQEGSRGVRTDVELHKTGFTLVTKDVLSEVEKKKTKKKQEEDLYESCKMEAELRVT